MAAVFGRSPASRKFGEARISAIKLSQEWYRENGTPYIGAFGDGTVEIAADEDIVRDHQALQYVGGIIKVPDSMRYKGRASSATATLALPACSAGSPARQGAVEYGYEPVSQKRRDPFDYPDDDDDEARDPFRQPLGASMSGRGLL